MSDSLTAALVAAFAAPAPAEPDPSTYKIDQLAFAAYNSADVAAVKARFGLTDAEWVEDEVLAVGRVNGDLGANRARLLFNYDLGIELEILQYLEGPNYLQVAGIKGGALCHVGMHWDGTGTKPVFGGMRPIQDVQTVTHTNPYLLERGRKYRYTIHNTLGSMGVFMKVIERLEDHEPTSDIGPNPQFVEVGTDPDVVPSDPQTPTPDPYLEEPF